MPRPAPRAPRQCPTSGNFGRSFQSAGITHPGRVARNLWRRASLQQLRARIHMFGYIYIVRYINSKLNVSKLVNRFFLTKTTFLTENYKNNS